MNLESKILSLQEQINAYKDLPDANKLNKNKEITDLINDCEKSINGYEEILQELINIKPIESEELTQEEFVELINEINTASQLVKTETNLDNMMSIMAEMSLNIKKCEAYLSSKQMTIGNL
jgi:hypothetical protein